MIFTSLELNAIRPEITQLLLQKQAEDSLPAVVGDLLPVRSQRRLNAGVTGAPGEGEGFTFHEPPPKAANEGVPPPPAAEPPPIKEPHRFFRAPSKGRIDRLINIGAPAIMGGAGVGYLANEAAKGSPNEAAQPAPTDAEMEQYRKDHPDRKLPVDTLTGGDALALGGGALAGGGLGYALSGKLKADPVASALVGAGAGGGLGYLIKRLATNKRP